MGFRARVYIQGVGQTRLSADKKSLEAFFPTGKAEEGFRLLALADDSGSGPKPNPKPATICEHHYFAQFSAQNLGQVEDVWLTVMLDRTDVVVEASGPLVAPLEVGPDGHVEGIANLSDLLAGTGVDPRQLRVDLEKDKAALLHGTLRLGQGKAKGFSTREWQVGYRSNGTERKVRMSGVVLVELGEVEELTLRMTSFDGKETRLLRLFPKATTKDVDLWIRHYCDLSRPDLNPPTTLPMGYTDWDFVLNYALLEGVRNLSDDVRRSLPLPTIKDGGQIGGNHTICQGAG